MILTGSALPPQQRLVMAWGMYGFTAEEIARELNTTPVAVRQSRTKARRILKQQLENPSRGGDA